ncbi:MAG: hypothetical protein R6V06_04490, partial [Kiritimatiellia bacterium]
LTELGEFVSCRNQAVAQSNMRIRKRLKQDQELKQNYERGCDFLLLKNMLFVPNSKLKFELQTKERL